MAKGIIVVDDIPVICAECDYVSLKNNGENLWCDVKHKFCYNAKPNWCPIRSALKKKDMADAATLTDLGWISGYNACIDEILKGDIPKP